MFMKVLRQSHLGKLIKSTRILTLIPHSNGRIGTTYGKEMESEQHKTGRRNWFLIYRRSQKKRMCLDLFLLEWRKNK